MAMRLPASQRTREELTALIEGRLSTASAKDELIKLASKQGAKQHNGKRHAIEGQPVPFECRKKSRARSKFRWHRQRARGQTRAQT